MNRNNSQRKATRSRIEKFQTLSFELELIKSKQEQIESMASQTQQSNPNPNPRDRRARYLPGLRATAVAGACEALVPPLAGLRGIVEPSARCSGTLGSRVRGSRAWLRPRPARRRRAHTLASARAGAVPPTPPATMASGRRRCVAWREKGEGERVARVSGKTGVAGFDPARVAAGRRIRSDGRESSVASRAE